MNAIRNICAIFLGVLSTLTACAQYLYFESGTATSAGNVTLVARCVGLTNHSCVLERLSGTNQVWSGITSFTLTNPATATTIVTTMDNRYGFFRFRSATNAYRSTNAFGSYIGFAPNGYSYIGNLFGTTAHTNILIEPEIGMLALKWNPAATNYTYAEYTGTNWTATLSITECEGMGVYNPSVYDRKFLVRGLFSTNIVAKALPAGQSLITSPRYQLIDYYNEQTDELSSLDPDGAAGLPVFSTGSPVQSKILRYNASWGGFDTYNFTTNSTWIFFDGTKPVPTVLAEGFFIDRPTTNSWSITRTIW